MGKSQVSPKFGQGIAFSEDWKEVVGCDNDRVNWNNPKKTFDKKPFQRNFFIFFDL